jgi:hypothetical protein
MWFALWGGLAVAYVTLIYVFERGLRQPTPAWFDDPAWGANRWDQIMMVCGAAGGVGVFAWGIARARTQWTSKTWVKRTAAATLVVLILTSAFAHMYGRKLRRGNFVQSWDAYHYALGPKYFPELGYFEQYDCTAHAMTTRQLSDRRTIRELRTYGNKKVADARLEDCKSRFTPERWEEFEADIQLWIKINSPNYVARMMGDFGYNGPPFHAAVYHVWLNSFEFDPSTVNMAATVDGLGVILMIGIVCWAFGWKVGLVFALLFFTEFADRGKAIGAAYARYPWFVCLGIALAALRKQAHAIAGGFFVLAAMFSVFPVLFSVGVFARHAMETVRTRALSRAFKRFVGGCVATTVLCGVVAAPIAGVDEYREFFDDMALHEQGVVDPSTGEQIVRQPSFGVGLKYPFMYRGRHKEKKKGINKFEKSRQFRQIEPLFWVCAWAISLVALGISTRLDDVEASILVGLVWFFCLFGTVYYYFTIFAFLALLYYRRYDRPSGVLLLTLFWGTSTIGYLTWLGTHANQVLYNSVLSTVWLAYLISVLVVLGVETGWWKDAARVLFGRRARSPDVDISPAESGAE